MKKLLWVFIIVPVGILLTAVAVANRHEVSLVLDPFAPANPALAVSMPFFVFLIIAMIVGVFLGGLGTWLTQGRWRRSARERALETHHWRLRAEKLHKQLELTGQQQLPPASARG